MISVSNPCRPGQVCHSDGGCYCDSTSCTLIGGCGSSYGIDSCGCGCSETPVQCPSGNHDFCVGQTVMIALYIVLATRVNFVLVVVPVMVPVFVNQLVVGLLNNAEVLNIDNCGCGCTAVAGTCPSGQTCNSNNQCVCSSNNSCNTNPPLPQSALLTL